MTIEDKLYHINIDPGADFAGNVANIKAALDDAWDGDFEIIDADSTKYIYIPQPVETSSVLLKMTSAQLYLRAGGIDLANYFGRGVNYGTTVWTANPGKLMDSTYGMCLEFDMRYYSTKHFYTIGYSSYKEDAGTALFPQKLVCRAKNVITGEYHNCVIQFTHSDYILFMAVAGQSTTTRVDLTAPFYVDNDVIRLRPITFGRFVVEGLYWIAHTENTAIGDHLSVTKLYPGHNNFSDITINNKKYRGINSYYSSATGCSIVFEV